MENLQAIICLLTDQMPHQVPCCGRHPQVHPSDFWLFLSLPQGQDWMTFPGQGQLQRRSFGQRADNPDPPLPSPQFCTDTLDKLSEMDPSGMAETWGDGTHNAKKSLQLATPPRGNRITSLKVSAEEFPGKSQNRCQTHDIKTGSK